MSKKRDSINKNNMNLVNIEPLTGSQNLAFEFWEREKHLVLHGHAGTGKTFIGLYLGLKELKENSHLYHNLCIIRSAVPSRDMGFLPGSKEEKSEVYEEPYINIVNSLFQRGDAYRLLKKNKGLIDFKTTSFLRGTTYDNTILLVDEIQNMNDAELNTILTRVGQDCKFILCGDYRQTDTMREKSGFHHAIRVLEKIRDVSIIEFDVNDIVRSGFVRDYLIERTKYMENKK